MWELEETPPGQNPTRKTSPACLCIGEQSNPPIIFARLTNLPLSVLPTNALILLGLSQVFC